MELFNINPSMALGFKFQLLQGRRSSEVKHYTLNFRPLPIANLEHSDQQMHCLFLYILYYNIALNTNTKYL